MIKKKTIRQLIEESHQPTPEENNEIVNRPFCLMCASYTNLLITAGDFSRSRGKWLRRPLVICKSCAKEVLPGIIELVESKPKKRQKP
jgi:hypothetical protein